VIYVLYSGDYEVFMGGNYRPESEILLEPASAALDVFESIGAPVTFFADLLCLRRYRELGFGEFPDQVDEQLREVVRRGHDVQMHIHPHWLKTEIERREDGSTHYQFDQAWLYPGPHFGEVYGFMLQHLVAGKEYLNRLLGDAAPAYRCVAYRAGGYGIVHGDREILAALEDAGYLIDSSVVPGFPGLGAAPGDPVNFGNVPRRGNYRLSREWGLARPAESGIFEIPVGAAVVREIGPMLRLKARAIRRRLFPRPSPHVDLGYTAGDAFRRKRPVARRSLASRVKGSITRGLSPSMWGMLEITADTQVMLDITRSYVRRYRDESPDLFFSVSFHPKDFVASKRDALREYHGMLQRCYGDEIRSITFREAADLIPPQPKDQASNVTEPLRRD
jgi:hypothetical protein